MGNKLKINNKANVNVNHGIKPNSLVENDAVSQQTMDMVKPIAENWVEEQQDDSKSDINSKG